MQYLHISLFLPPIPHTLPISLYPYIPPTHSTCLRRGTPPISYTHLVASRIYPHSQSIDYLGHNPEPGLVVAGALRRSLYEMGREPRGAHHMGLFVFRVNEGRGPVRVGARAEFGLFDFRVNEGATPPASNVRSNPVPVGANVCFSAEIPTNIRSEYPARGADLDYTKNRKFMIGIPATLAPRPRPLFPSVRGFRRSPHSSVIAISSRSERIPDQDVYNLFTHCLHII